MIDRIVSPARLTRGRMLCAIAIAVAADVLQIMLVPLMWTFAQSLVDVVAMALVVLVLGFHPLLLPTFIIELIPGVDVIPTWTGCVIAVLALRKSAERKAAPPPIVETEERKQLGQ
jgi:hypothetical protein